MKKPISKYSKGDVVEIQDSNCATCRCIIRRVNYEISNNTFYYTVSDGDRYPFQVNEDAIKGYYKK